MDLQKTMHQIDKIRAKLSPQEFFLLWLGDAPPFDAAEDCAAWVFGRAAAGCDRIAWLRGEVASAVRSQLVGHALPYVEARVARAQQDVFFLYFLYIRLNVHVVTQAPIYHERCLDLNRELSRTLELVELLLRLEKNPSLVNTDQTSPGGPKDQAEIRRCVVVWEAQLGDLRKKGRLLKRGIAETQLVVDLINRVYFAERLVLWGSAAEVLDTSQPDKFNVLEERLRAADELAKAEGFESPANLPDTQRAAEARVKKTVQRVVALARVDAARHMGKREEARELLVRRMKREENCDAEAEALLGLESPGGRQAQSEI